MARKGGFGKVDIKVMSDPELSAMAKSVYACLSCYADNNRECYPSRATLIGMLGISKVSFDKYMSELISKGIVKKTPLKNGNIYNGILYKINDFVSDA